MAPKCMESIGRKTNGLQVFVSARLSFYRSFREKLMSARQKLVQNRQRRIEQLQGGLSHTDILGARVQSHSVLRKLRGLEP
jgi:hypothetical protein